MQPQSATLTLLVGALIGATITVSRKGQEDAQLLPGSDNLHNLQPGDEITIKVGSDEAWLERAKAAELADLDAQARADIAANPQAGEDLTGKPGMTLAEGLEAAERQQPDVEASAGDVAVDDGAQRTRKTGKG